MRRLSIVVLFAAATLPAKAQTKPAAPPKPAAAPKTPASVPPATAAYRPDLAYGAYQRGLYKTAFREAFQRVRTDPNDAAAMTLLAELYSQGLGLKQDTGEAVGWYRLAAARGSAKAMTALGMLSIEGRGLPRDPAAARDWLEKAAAKGEPLAAYNLALVLLDNGSEEDLARAARLLAVAANAEIPEAQHALGVMRSRGQGGLPRDKAEAALLYQRAAYNGSLAGEVEFAIVAFNGDGVPRDEKLAARHFAHAAARGNAIAQNRFARLYVLGRGVPRNPVESLAWHLTAKAQGLNDPWLEEQLKDLSPAERAQAQKLSDERSTL